MTTPETTAQNKALVRRIYEECINQARLDLLPELIDAEFTGENGEKGPPAYRATVEGLMRAFPDLRFTVERLIAEGDQVVVRWVWTGTHRAPFRGFAATQRAVRNTGTAIYRIRDGKVAAVELETDRLGVLQQLEIVPKDLTQLRATR